MKTLKITKILIVIAANRIETSKNKPKTKTVMTLMIAVMKEVVRKMEIK